MSRQGDIFTCAYAGSLLAGVDEAGRGPLVGNVVAAAVILDPARPVQGLADSKKLAPRKREYLAELVRERALAWSVAWATPQEIDTINILQASLLAMQRAVQALHLQPEYVLVDGNRLPRWSFPSEAVVKGDSRVAVISAASILAKVHRDQEMEAMEVEYPGYGFAEHKGYPTARHLAALQEKGPTPHHRLSYAPVAALARQGVSSGAQ